MRFGLLSQNTTISGSTLSLYAPPSRTRSDKEDFAELPAKALKGCAESQSAGFDEKGRALLGKDNR
jgi:hypothetical protein